MLIKALANAEKDKQAERNKNQTVDKGLSLELAPKESTSQPPSVSVKGVTQTKKTDAQLLLEEEAGLGAIPAEATKKIEPRLDSNLTKSPLAEKAATIKPALTMQLDTAPKLKPSSVTNHSILAEGDINQKAAAKVFVANQAAKPPSSIGTLVLLGVGGAMLGMARFASLHLFH